MYFPHIIKRFFRIYLYTRPITKTVFFWVGGSAVKAASCQAGTADKDRRINAEQPAVAYRKIFDV